MFHADAVTTIEQELSRGEAARREGLEGRARVCARRAAGAAIREFLKLRGLPQAGPSAVDLLDQLRGLVEQGGMLAEHRPQVAQVIDHLLMRVDESYSLPIEADLLAEVRWLAQTLEENT